MMRGERGHNVRNARHQSATFDRIWSRMLRTAAIRSSC